MCVVKDSIHVLSPCSVSGGSIPGGHDFRRKAVGEVPHDIPARGLWNGFSIVKSLNLLGMDSFQTMRSLTVNRGIHW
jgi:hypothetical protein